jgi:chromate reductase, NAD(P)H dehydrogenase (quinone)
MTRHKIAILVGSLREGSINRKIAKALIAAAPQSLDCQVVEIGDLPLYNEDREADPPAKWITFRDAVRAADGVLFVSPEYNRSVPGGLKNAIDIGSRPYGKSVFSKKPAAVVTASPGAIGGFGSNHNLRQSCVFLDMPVMQQPESYLSSVKDEWGEDGRPADARLAALLDKIIRAYAKWVDLILPDRPLLASDATDQ